MHSEVFGNLTPLGEESRAMWSFAPWEHLAQDLRYAARALRNAPGFTAVAVLSLALGIGANTAIFSLIDALILRRLPVQRPEQLFALTRSNLPASSLGSFNYPFYRELRQRGDLFSGVLCERTMTPSLAVRGNVERVSQDLVSGNYFDVLGLKPYAGRLLHSYDETAPGADRLVVLSYAYWKRRFDGDAGAIGTVITLNTTPMTVVGVSPPEFDGLRAGLSPDVYVPITMWPWMFGDPSQVQSQRVDWFQFIVCRLKPGVAKGQAEAAVTAFYRNYTKENGPGAPLFLRASDPLRLSLIPAATGLRSRAANAAAQLYVLMTVVGLVLLAACVNLANLLLARTAARQREIAVRLSLGAARGRIIRQLLTESMLLAGMGGGAGIVCAYWGAQLLFRFLMAGQFGMSIHLSPDWRILSFTLGVSLATGVLSGLAPAVRSTRFELAPELKGETARLPGTRIVWRKALVSTQIALSLLLLIGAGLFLRSLANLRMVNIGFDSRNVLEIALDATLSGYKQDGARAFYRDVAERVSHLPGVLSTSYARNGLITGLSSPSGITLEGYQPKPGDPNPYRNFVGPGYFATLRIPIIRGREFEPRDTKSSPHAAIVSESFARFYFGHDDPIGKRIGPGAGRGPADFEIVGIARDSKYDGLREQTKLFWYIPYQQYSSIDNIILYVRTASDPLTQVDSIRRAIRSVNPNVPTFRVKTIDEQIDEYLATDRMIAAASTFFSFLAALLAAIGLYGVMTYAIVTRTREIGIRVALGARQSDVVRPVMGEVAATILAGVAVGVPCAIALGRFVASMLFGLKPADPIVLLAGCLFMTTVALIAGYLPARRAARIDPMIALRFD
jgi:predicted permease